MRGLEHALHVAARVVRHEHDHEAALARATRAAAAVHHRLRVVRQVGVDHEPEVGQVEPTRGHIGRDTHPGAPVAQLLQRRRALALRQLARQRRHGKAALREVRREVGDPIARRAEHERPDGVVEPQHVHHVEIALALDDRHRAVLDVGVALVGGLRREAQRVLLELLRHRGDVARDGRGEQQRAALGGRRLEQLFDVLAEAHVEHLVGLVEHDAGELRQRQRAAGKVIREPPWRADDDVHPSAQLVRLAARIEATDARRDARTRLREQPLELAEHLLRELARRRDHEGERGARLAELELLAEEGRRDPEAEGDGLARSRLGRHEQVARGVGREHGSLHRGGLGVGLLDEGDLEAGVRAVERRGGIGQSGAP